MSCARRIQPAGYIRERDRGALMPSPPLHGSRLRPRDGPLRPGSSAEARPSPSTRVSGRPLAASPPRLSNPAQACPVGCGDGVQNPRHPGVIPSPRSPLPSQTPGKRRERFPSPLRLLPSPAQKPLSPRRDGRTEGLLAVRAAPATLALLCRPPPCSPSSSCPFCGPLAAPAAYLLPGRGHTPVPAPLTHPPLPTPAWPAASGHLHRDVLPAPRTPPLGR